MSNRTKLWIAEAMRQLMTQKSLDKIRVTEICQIANIERPTFYYHFKDKYDLVSWIFFNTITNTNILSTESIAKNLATMKQDFLFYKRAYEDTSQTPLWKYMFDYFVAKYTQKAQELLATSNLNQELQFDIRFYCYGCVGISREWLLFDKNTSAEVIAQRYFNAMPVSLRTIFFKDS
ncbi:TetR/AcrR family transcriptional regulator C-terminal domain-containing protein [Veillonella criceti]|uniref:HTH-type dhaKLM operon transcriptional activator dhaS n=1 Tax=Veillonella criceti TaxID=103891 RepID=A0A380NNR9_9FIRM|nr:TetR/AcrR family transcriptional regulator C-terminal domain-containing protein [Veillonella criceti]SUP44923.1 HTH-type dhaKLM operon transcriptional activator dhaS [Veillonella criceti]